MGFPENVFKYQVSNGGETAQEVAAHLKHEIVKNFNHTSKYEFLEISTDSTCFVTAEIWDAVEPLLASCPSSYLPWIVKYQSLDSLVVACTRSRGHDLVQSLYEKHISLSLRPFEGRIGLGTKLQCSPGNVNQTQRADIVAYDQQTGSRRIMAEILLCQSVEFGMKQMLAQLYINKDIKLFILAFFIIDKGSFYHVLQFYTTVLKGPGVYGSRIGSDFEYSLIGEQYCPNGSNEPVDFVGDMRSTSDAELYLVDEFVGLYDTDASRPVRMKVIPTSMSTKLDLSENSLDSRRDLTFNLAPYLDDDLKECEAKLNVRAIFASINQLDLDWGGGAHRLLSLEETEIVDSRDSQFHDFVKLIYDDELAAEEDRERLEDPTFNETDGEDTAYIL